MGVEGVNDFVGGFGFGFGGVCGCHGALQLRQKVVEVALEEAGVLGEGLLQVGELLVVEEDAVVLEEGAGELVGELAGWGASPGLGRGGRVRPEDGRAFLGEVVDAGLGVVVEDAVREERHFEGRVLVVEFSLALALALVTCKFVFVFVV